MTIKIEIERDYVKIEGQTVFRPERIVPGDWIETLERVTDESAGEAYQRGYDDGFADGVEDGY